MDILVPLTENHEYKRVYARGKSAVRPALVLYCLRNKKVKQARVGITASKKIGNAVKRSRGMTLSSSAAAERRSQTIKSYLRS